MPSYPIFRTLSHGRTANLFPTKRDIQGLSDELNRVLAGSLVEIRIYLWEKTLEEVHAPRFNWTDAGKLAETFPFGGPDKTVATSP